MSAPENAGESYALTPRPCKADAGGAYLDYLHPRLPCTPHAFLFRVLTIGGEQVELLQFSARIQAEQYKFRHDPGSLISIDAATPMAQLWSSAFAFAVAGFLSAPDDTMS